MKQSKKIILRFLAIVSVIAIVCASAIPVFATSGQNFSKDEIERVDPLQDFITSKTEDGVKWYYLRPETQSYFTKLTIYDQYKISQGASRPGSISFVNRAGFTTQFGGYKYFYNGLLVDGYTFDIDVSFFDLGNLLYIGNLDDSCEIDVSFRMVIDPKANVNYQNPKPKNLEITYYDAKGRVIYSQYASTVSVDSNMNVYGVTQVSKPDGAFYASVGINFDSFEIYSNKFTDVEFRYYDVIVRCGIPTGKPLTQNILDIYSDTIYEYPYKYYQVKGSNDIASVRLQSQDPNYTSIYGANWNSISFIAQPGDTWKYDITFRLFQANKYLDLSNVKDGSYVHTAFDFTIEADGTWYYPDVTLFLIYYDAQFNQIHSSPVYLGTDYEKVIGGNSGTINQLMMINKPEGAQYFSTQIRLYNFRLHSNTTTAQPVTIKCDKYSVLFELEDSMGYLEDFKNTNDKFDSLTDQLQTEKPDINSINVGIDNLIDFNAVTAYSNVLSVVWTSPSLTSFLCIILTLGLISYVLFGKKG